MNRNNS